MRARKQFTDDVIVGMLKQLGAIGDMVGAGSATELGLTKLYTGTGSNTDGTITQKAITEALNGKLSSIATTLDGQLKFKDSEGKSGIGIYTGDGSNVILGYNNTLTSGTILGTAKTETVVRSSGANDLYHMAGSTKYKILDSGNTVNATQTVGGLMSPTDKKKLDGIAEGANAYSHPESGVTAGTYRSVTVDKYGHITSGSNPTLGIADGGTGATTAKGAEYNILGDMPESTASITDNAIIVFKKTSPTATSGVTVYKKASLFWDYIKGKSDATYLALAGGTMTGNLVLPTGSSASTADGLVFGSNVARIASNNSGGLGFYSADAIYLRPGDGEVSSNYGLKLSTTDLSPSSTNSVTLGTSSLKWKNVYATTFTGALSGNASTASAMKSVQITSNTDLNTCQTVGSEYYCSANATALTLTNCPTDNAFHMRVGKHAGIYQELTEYMCANPKKYFRNFYNSTWGSWYRIYTSADKPTLSDLGVTATTTELNYVDGVTSAIQTQLDNKALKDHTHSYAGSASAGGSATSAVKLDTESAGDANTPVYFSGGKPVACTSLDLNTSGNAGTATTWATARIVNGMSINGSANRINYGVCSVSSATKAKTVAVTGFSLINGAEVTVKFSYVNTASAPTLNVNSTGAKPIYYKGAVIPTDYIVANGTYTFRYNGTQWEVVGDIGIEALKKSVADGKELLADAISEWEQADSSMSFPQREIQKDPPFTGRKHQFP